jgi:hypothetical protein
MGAIDAVIGFLLAVAVWGFLHAFELPRGPIERRNLSLAAGVLVWLCASGSLLFWHHQQLAARERNARAAAAAALTQTTVPVLRSLEEAH